MQCVIIGAGPTGLVLGMGLARRSHLVTIVERDAGPQADGTWPRHGVMQFHQAHVVRPQVGSVLLAEAPTAYERVLKAGAEPVTTTLPDGSTMSGGLRCRRSTLERAMREAALVTPGLTLRQGHVERVRAHGRRAIGVRVDGTDVPADLVVDASGRVGRVSQQWRERSTLGGDTGIAYVERQYKLLPGAEPGPLSTGTAWLKDFVGFQVLVILYEHGIFSVVLVRPADDLRLRGLRHESAYEAACRAIPGVATWTDPERAKPITPVLVGGRLLNHYRSQRGPDGALALSGLFFVGDSVATTTPNFGRGLATSLVQVAELLRLCDVHGCDLTSAGEAFGAWCDATMRPWVQDHVHMDEAKRRRWAGEDIDLTERVPSDLILAAIPADPRIGVAVAPYLSMSALPSCLNPVEPLARAVYESGWRPTLPNYPTRDDLAGIVAEHEPTGEASAGQDRPGAGGVQQLGAIRSPPAPESVTSSTDGSPHTAHDSDTRIPADHRGPR